MLEEHELDLLRCPLDPRREAKLVYDDTKVVCSRCRVMFRSKEGILSLLVDEAVLPEGCASAKDLPCRE